MHSTEPTLSQALIAERNQPISQCFRMVKRFALLFGLTMACCGCSLTQGLNNYLAYNDNCNDFVMGWRNEVWATQAWHNQKHHFADHTEFRAFGAGFRDGYQAVASGGNGCPPPMPPRKYWTWKYQTAEGQCKVAAWFEGYGHGARAAEEDGAGNFQDIQVSYAIEAQYSPEFQAGQIPHFGHGEYIIPGETTEGVPYESLPTEVPNFAPPTHVEGAGIVPASWNSPAPPAIGSPAPAIGWPPQLAPPMSPLPQ